MASSPRDEALVRLLLERWTDKASGLDAAKTFDYKVLLSFPSKEQPNTVEVGEGLARSAGVGRAAAWGADSTFPHSGPQWQCLPLLHTLREESERGFFATLCCLLAPWDSTGEPRTATAISQISLVPCFLALKPRHLRRASSAAPHPLH